MKWVMLGAILGGVGVGMGAFGAHGLDDHFQNKYAETENKTIAGYKVSASYKYLQDYKTGVRYHMYHALALIGLGVFSMQLSGAAAARRAKWLNAAGWLFLAGILLFPGSLYVLTILGPKWLGVTWGLIAAVGGTAFIAGWMAFAVGACCCGKRE